MHTTFSVCVLRVWTINSCFALCMRIFNDKVMRKYISLNPLTSCCVPAPLPWLSTCYLREWGVISAPTRWMHLHFSWWQLKWTPLGQIIWLGYCHVNHRPVHHSTWARFVSLLLWMSTVYLCSNTYSVMLLFIALYLPPPLASSPRTPTTELSVNRMLYY